MADADLIRLFEAKIAGTCRKRSTAADYRTALNNWARALGRPPTVADLTVDQVLTAATWHRSAANRRRPWSVDSYRHFLRAIHSVWAALATRGLAPDPPPRGAFGRLSPSRRVSRSWNDEQMDQLFAACRRLQGTIGEVPLADYASALNRWLENSGERIEATLAISWQDVDLQQQWALIPGEFRKNGKPFAVSLTATTVAALREIRRPGQAKVFGWAWRSAHVYTRLMRVVVVLAGLAGDDQLRRDLEGRPFARTGSRILQQRLRDAVPSDWLFHNQRRTFATRVYRRTKNLELARRWLDHASIETTRGYIDYTQVDDVTQRDVIGESRPVQLRLFG